MNDQYAQMMLNELRQDRCGVGKIERTGRRSSSRNSPEIAYGRGFLLSLCGLCGVWSIRFRAAACEIAIGAIRCMRMIRQK